MSNKYNIAKFTRRWKIWALASLVWLPLTASATSTCTRNYSGRTDYIDQNVSVLSNNVTVSALRDLPTGSVIFRQYIFNSDPAAIGAAGCKAAVSSDYVLIANGIKFEGAEPAIIGKYEDGLKVYSTGVPGIGMAIGVTVGNNLTQLSSTSNIPYTGPLVRGAGGAGSYYLNQGFELLLVKVGDISPGVWNVPISYPPIIRYAQTSNTTEIIQDYGYRWHINGSVNVVAGTCQTPDVTVPMGVHSIHDSTTTEWVNFNINLLNCPPMYGRYNRNSRDTSSTAVIRWNSETDYTTAGPDTANSIRFSLYPVSGYGAMAAGGTCAALTNDSDVAIGMCIDIQNNAGENILANSWRNILTDANLTLQQTTASYSIPLKARYARSTASTLTAGKANAAVEFTINYQ